MIQLSETGGSHKPARLVQDDRTKEIHIVPVKHDPEYITIVLKPAQLLGLVDAYMVGEFGPSKPGRSKRLDNNRENTNPLRVEWIGEPVNICRMKRVTSLTDILLRRNKPRPIDLALSGFNFEIPVGISKGREFHLRFNSMKKLMGFGYLYCDTYY